MVQYLTTKIKRDADFFRVDKYDDPNTSVNKLMLALRNLEFAGEFPVNKLKQAHGEACCSVLNFLTDAALEAVNFSFAPPKHTDGDEPDEVEVDEDENDDDIEDEVEVEEENDKWQTAHHQDNESAMIDPAKHEIITSLVDPIEWKTELERVGPRLRANKNEGGGKEWRVHIDQTTKHENTIQKELPATEASLQAINKELAEAVEKMTSKEKYINSQYANLISEYTQIRDSMKGIEETFNSGSSNVSVLQNDLSEISEQLSEIKNTMDSKGSNMTDTSPLVKIKKALQDIKTEINTFEMRIGVLGHTLLQGQVQGEKNGGEGSGESKDNLDDDEDDFV